MFLRLPSPLKFILVIGLFLYQVFIVFISFSNAGRVVVSTEIEERPLSDDFLRGVRAMHAEQSKLQWYFFFSSLGLVVLSFKTENVKKNSQGRSEGHSDH